jgi:hypothetical protein
VTVSGTAVDLAPIQEDPYNLPREDFKLIACLVQELLCCTVGVQNCDAVAAEVAVASSSTLVF